MKSVHEFYSDEEAQAYFLREIAVQLVELNEYLRQERVTRYTGEPQQIKVQFPKDIR